MTQAATDHGDGMDTRLVVVEDFAERLLQAAGRRDYDAIISSTDGLLVASSRTTDTRRLRLGKDRNEITAYLKMYRPTRGFRPWWMRDKAVIEVDNYALLRERCGVSVPRVLAYGCRRSRWHVLNAFILTEAVAGAVPLDEYERHHWPEGPSRYPNARRRRLLTATADLVADLHTARFCHIDLQWRNLLVSDTKAGPVLHVIDCARGGRRTSALRWWHGRLRDLSSLYKLGRFRLSLAEQVRWLRRYLGVRRLRPEDRLLVHSVLFDRRLKDHNPSQEEAIRP